MEPTLLSSAKSILVVGASSGIGRDLAQALLALPSAPTIILSARRQDRLEQIIADAPHASDRLHALPVDISAGPAALNSYANTALAKYPQVS